MKRIFYSIATTLLLISCNNNTQSEASVEKDNRPNIVIFFIDDLGYGDLGCYGSEVTTPNIDALCNEGIQFANYHTAATCSPSRSMLLTGVDNHLTGMGNMIEIMADNQFDQPGYEGYMSQNVVTLPSLLKDAGYHTYMAGKWHLGKSKESLPAARGFEQSITLVESGADNWEKKSYLPLYDYVHFYEGFEETDLPEDFFSSNYYIDRLKEYIDADRSEDRKPFFAYASFQAQHYPHQAPQSYTDHYMNSYQGGWDELIAKRYARQVELGLMPAGLEIKANPIAPIWQDLSDEEKKIQSKKMAIYAGMLENLDANIGRFISYLKEINEYDNTVFLFISDNGADNNEQDKVFPDWYAANFDMSYDKMGLKGSYMNYGPGWAGASGTPLKSFKGSASEGGMRVPMIIAGPGIQKGVLTNEFVFVSDITPTLLEMLNIDVPRGIYKGREVHDITGNSILSFLQGNSESSYSQSKYVVYELAGSAAIFRDNYKLTKNNPPFGDKQWRLFHLIDDPTESNDLSDSNPEMVKDMLDYYNQFTEDVKLIEVPEDYNPVLQVQKNVERNNVEELKEKVPVTFE